MWPDLRGESPVFLICEFRCVSYECVQTRAGLVCEDCLLPGLSLLDLAEANTSLCKSLICSFLLPRPHRRELIEKGVSDPKGSRRRWIPEQFRYRRGMGEKLIVKLCHNLMSSMRS